MKSIWKQTLAKVRDNTASAQPVATSGAMSNIVAVYACSLIRMSLILSSEKTSGKRRLEKIMVSLEKLEQSSKVLTLLADKDITVFQGFLDAFGMPGSDTGDKKRRSDKIRSRRLESIQVPLQSVDEIMKISGIIYEVITVCSRNLLCDLAVAANMLECSELSLLRIVKENGNKLSAAAQLELSNSAAKLVRKSRAEWKLINLRISTLLTPARTS